MKTDCNGAKCRLPGCVACFLPDELSAQARNRAMHVAGGASAPPPLPRAELLATAETLKQYAYAYSAWASAQDQPLGDAARLATRLFVAADSVVAAADYFGPYVTPSWEKEATP